MLAGPLVWLIALAIERLLPQYGGAVALLAPMMLAAVLRVSDFWTSLLIVIEREGLVLASQSAAIFIALAGYVAWLIVAGIGPTPLSLAWLAFATALLSHAASAAGVYACLLRTRRQPLRISS